MQIENLTDAHSLIHIRVDEKPKYKDLPLHLVDRDVTRNPRDEQTAFRTVEVAMIELVDSMRVKGYIPGHPIIVIEYRDESGKVRYLTLRGNRRVWCAKHLGLETIPAVVYAEGSLTEEQQLVIICDHDQEAKIGPIGELICVENWLKAGLSYKAIAQMLRWVAGKKNLPNINKVQGYAELLKLPPVVVTKDDGTVVEVSVLEQWKLQQRDSKDKAIVLPPISLSVDVRHLYESRTKDITSEDKRIEESGSCEANRYMLEPGPELVKAMTELVETGSTPKSKQAKAGLTPSALIGLGELTGNHPMLAKLFFGLGGKPGYKHGPLIKDINDALFLVYPNVTSTPSVPVQTVEDIFSTEASEASEASEPTEPVAVVADGGRRSKRSR